MRCCHAHIWLANRCGRLVLHLPLIPLLPGVEPGAHPQRYHYACDHRHRDTQGMSPCVCGGMWSHGRDSTLAGRVDCLRSHVFELHGMCVTPLRPDPDAHTMCCLMHLPYTVCVYGCVWSTVPCGSPQPSTLPCVVVLAHLYSMCVWVCVVHRPLWVTPA